jgi:hypothetical protein
MLKYTIKISNIIIATIHYHILYNVFCARNIILWQFIFIYYTMSFVLETSYYDNTFSYIIQCLLCSKHHIMTIHFHILYNVFCARNIILWQFIFIYYIKSYVLEISYCDNLFSYIIKCLFCSKHLIATCNIQSFTQKLWVINMDDDNFQQLILFCFSKF